MDNETRAEEVRKKYDEAHTKVLEKFTQLRKLVSGMQDGWPKGGSAEDTAKTLGQLDDLVFDLDNRIDDMHIAAGEVGRDLADAASLADAYEANATVNEAVRKAEAFGAWGTVRTILEAAQYAAAERHGAHNVEAQTLEAFMQYRA